MLFISANHTMHAVSHAQQNKRKWWPDLIVCDSQVNKISGTDEKWCAGVLKSEEKLNPYSVLNFSINTKGGGTTACGMRVRLRL
jgi:hypothetical protein